MHLIKDFTDEVILALDNDDSGRKATRRLITGKRPNKVSTTAWGNSLNVSVFNYGGSTAKDPGDMTDAEIEFGIDKAIHSTEWL